MLQTWELHQGVMQTLQASYWMYLTHSFSRLIRFSCVVLPCCNDALTNQQQPSSLLACRNSLPVPTVHTQMESPQAWPDTTGTDHAHNGDSAEDHSERDYTFPSRALWGSSNVRCSRFIFMEQLLQPVDICSAVLATTHSLAYRSVICKP